MTVGVYGKSYLLLYYDLCSLQNAKCVSLSGALTICYLKHKEFRAKNVAKKYEIINFYISLNFGFMRTIKYYMEVT